LAHARKIKAHVDAKLASEGSGAVKGGSGHATPMGEMERRRLLFLQDTLANVISKFDKEYPECRLPPADDTINAPAQDASTSTLPQTSIEKPHPSPPPADADDGLISAPTKPAAAYDDEHTLRPSL